jgi:hypothetical protein
MTRFRCYLVLVLGLTTACDAVDGEDSDEIGYTASTLTIAWDDNANDEDGYRLERKTGTGGSFALVGTLSANSSTFADVLLEPEQTYCYRVQAFNSAGASAWSNEACAVAPGLPADAGVGGVDAGTGSGSDTTPPTIALTAPADGAVVRAGAQVALRATANDDVGVTAVDFSINGNVVCSDTSAPFACVWNVSSTRRRVTYTVEATAHDAAGNQASDSVTVRKR